MSRGIRASCLAAVAVMAATLWLAPVAEAKPHGPRHACHPRTVTVFPDDAAAYKLSVTHAQHRLRHLKAVIKKHRHAIPHTKKPRAAARHRRVIRRARRALRRVRRKLACGTRYVNLSIKVDGNRLLNAKGHSVTLHGVNISGTEWQCLYGGAFWGPSDDASIDAIAGWHANVVRIPLNEDCWLGINGAPTHTAAFKDALRDYIDRLHAHGMYAILDLHWNAPGDTLSHLGPGFAGFFEMADADHAPDFWSSVASYFRDDHALLFDLFNEPRDVSWDCWRNGGCLGPRGYAVAGMQQLVDAVRGAGATQPVMVGGLNMAADLGPEWLDYRPSDALNQVAASYHTYGASPAELEKQVAPVSAQVPVVTGEIGETDCAHGLLDYFLPWADSHNVSYVAWAWIVAGCASYPALIANYDGTPTDYGVAFRDHLRQRYSPPLPLKHMPHKQRRYS
jgi:endoglucanase